MKNQIKTLLALLFLSNSTVVRASGYIGDTPWMHHAPSVYGASMGRVYASNVEGANTIFSNPGAAAFIDGISLSWQAQPYPEHVDAYRINAFDEVSRDSYIGNYAGLIRVFKNSYLALGRRAHTEDTAFWLVGDRVLYNESINVLSFGTQITNIGLGVNLKRYSATIERMDGTDNSREKVNADTYVMDFGCMASVDILHSQHRKITVRAGAVIQNIGASAKYSNGVQTELPINAEFGYTAEFKYSKNREIVRFIQTTGYAVTVNHQYDHDIFISPNVESLILELGGNYSVPWNSKRIGTGAGIVIADLLSSRVGYTINFDDNLSFYKQLRHLGYLCDNGFSYGFGIKVPIPKRWSGKQNYSVEYNYGRYMYVKDKPFVDPIDKDHLSVHGIDVHFTY